MNNTLITRDTKGKCRVIHIKCTFDETNKKYKIERSSGLFGGKFIEQPTLEITKGKVKRTTEEQAELEYNSIIKKYLDKGYKKVESLGITELTEETIEQYLPLKNTDQKGMKKPMLCKVLDKNNKTLTEKTWKASYKLDGVRCFLFWSDEKIRTSSRGGQDYDISAEYILKDPYLISLFKNNPELILDGEIYRHGWPLNKISGLCRKEVIEPEHSELMFYCYDIVDENKTFKDRLKILQEIGKNCPPDSKLHFLPHTEVKGLKQIMLLHDEAVKNGYEGLVIRDPDKEYKCGCRDNRMLKIKEFTDDEFEICDIVEGLREEDMCFLMKTKENNFFKAKPIGTREDKQWYREHIEEIKGKMGTVKYFGYTNTDNPVPNLPVFKSIRNYEDM